jgi:hypothetical protein
MPLRVLACRDIPAKDFQALQGMPLQRIWIDDPASSRVRPVLRSMPNLQEVNGEWWQRW